MENTYVFVFLFLRNSGITWKSDIWVKINLNGVAHGLVSEG